MIMREASFKARHFIAVAAAAFACIAVASCGQKTATSPFNVANASITDIQAALKDGRVTSRELVTQYLARIGLYDNTLHGTISVDPNVLAEADTLDKERAAGHIRGPLHGIPIALKDNIMTTTMPTSGGMLAFKHYIPPYEATLVKNLRDAGAIIIAKSTMSELAGALAEPPTPAPGGYNAVRGFSYNPFDPREKDNGEPVLSPAGSSSGIGVAAGYWAANIGTDTSGSVLGPSSAAMIVGLRPTIGRISRYGIIPITVDQDTAGPMARTVTDVAILLGVLEGKAPDPNDAATNTCKPPENHDYTQFLKADALKGARIGIPRTAYYTEFTPPGATRPHHGLKADEAQAMEEAIAALKAAGAEIVDPADIPSVTTPDPTKNVLRRIVCIDKEPGDPADTNQLCSYVLGYGMKRDLNAWLATLGAAAPVHTMTELREWNTAHAADGAIKFGQAFLDGADALDLEKDKARYEEDRAKDKDYAGAQGIDAALSANKLDALIIPGGGASSIGALAGDPAIVVPFAMVTNPGAPKSDPPDAKTRPFGFSFLGAQCSEPKLLALAYSFEQATHRRQTPKATP
jgi:amidase